MASESTEEGSVTVSLDPELEEWLDARASDLGVDRETVLVRLLSSHRSADALEESSGVEALAAELADAEPVREAVAETLDRAVDDAVDGRLPAETGDDDGSLEGTVREQVELALEDRLRREVESVVASVIEHQVASMVETEAADRIESVRADFGEKLEDVRERVIQVKREADAKAPADHTHDAFARVDAIGGRLADVEESVAAIESDLSGLRTAVESIDVSTSETDEELAGTVEEVEERLKTVAWVVSDLREAYESHDSSATLERLKRSAAEADAARAKCERCGEGVEIALLTDPKCPHCQATVTEVAPARGIFRKPRLLAASQLEAGDER